MAMLVCCVKSTAFVCVLLRAVAHNSNFNERLVHMVASLAPVSNDDVLLRDQPMHLHSRPFTTPTFLLLLT